MHNFAAWYEDILRETINPIRYTISKVTTAKIKLQKTIWSLFQENTAAYLWTLFLNVNFHTIWSPFMCLVVCWL